MAKKLNILVITYWSFNDALIQTYTIPYLRIIKQLNPGNFSITLVTQEKDHTQISSLTQSRDADFNLIALPYYPFGAKAFLSWRKNLRFLKKKIDELQINVLHSWCTPAGMIAYLLNKKKNLHFIADSFEPHAEAMVENGSWKKKSIAFKLLFRYEKLQAKTADEIISIAPGMDDYCLHKYGIQIKRSFIKPACTDLNLFSGKQKNNAVLKERLGLGGKIVCVYAGKFGGIYLDEEVFHLLKEAYLQWGDKLRVLLLSNEKPETIQQKAEAAGIPKEIFVVKFVPHAEVPAHMGLADFALCPVKPVPTKKYCSPIKTGEYWALGLPVIITKNISNDSEIIEKHKAGYVVQELNTSEYKRAVNTIDALLKENTAEQLYAKIRPLAEQYRNFAIAEKIYTEIYSGLNT